ncbi:hypothetical protein C0J52_01805 [Blattella germanica]|nr:hypothetical protein C0J52_01805 [Blattella germanica]
MNSSTVCYSAILRLSCDDCIMTWSFAFLVTISGEVLHRLLRLSALPTTEEATLSSAATA